jgi:putative protease
LVAVVDRQHANDGSPPAILAPAGSRPAFLAALAAGAEAVYCGLKEYSARMEAANFTVEELAALTALAHAKGARVFVALNTLIKPGELAAVGRLVERLNREVAPDALIVQDLAMAGIIRQAGFPGEVVWSTLANATHPAALAAIRGAVPIDALVLPRELTVDEVRAMAAACPPGMGLEVFVHGALCYGVSGRCYWSSFLGGRSGLRGRCVQPCRRLYAQAGGAGRRRLFSCLDLSLDVLVKVLRGIPQIRAWKIEGRKKGPHYVYYIVTGYRLLRDHFHDPRMKRDALAFIAQALGRPGTHYYFLPQRKQNPVDPAAETASGLFVGRVAGAAGRTALAPRVELLAGDLLRVGAEDEPGHRLERIGRGVPRGGRFSLPAGVPKGTPVFLIDRREKALEALIAGLAAELPAVRAAARGAAAFAVRLPKPYRPPLRKRPVEMRVGRTAAAGRGGPEKGFWLGKASLAGVGAAAAAWWWLDPVIFPDEEAEAAALIAAARARGARRFVLNAPWQTALFPGGGAGCELWAGPFCNLANPLALEAARRMGFTGAIVSPELGAAECLALPAQSPLPLGVVVSGSWPLCIARPAAAELKLGRPFRSPKGEEAWAVRHGALVWVYPNWNLDLGAHREELARSGYRLCVHLDEPRPAAVALKARPGVWNWEIGLR